jgi:hypothetical protein
MLQSDEQICMCEMSDFGHVNDLYELAFLKHGRCIC